MIIIQIILLTSLELADSIDDCDLPDDPNTSYLHLTTDGSVLYKSPADMAGWQFEVDGGVNFDNSNSIFTAFLVFPLTWITTLPVKNHRRIASQLKFCYRLAWL